MFDYQPVISLQLGFSRSVPNAPVLCSLTLGYHGITDNIFGRNASLEDRFLLKHGIGPTILSESPQS